MLGVCTKSFSPGIQPGRGVDENKVTNYLSHYNTSQEPYKIEIRSPASEMPVPISRGRTIVRERQGHESMRTTIDDAMCRRNMKGTVIGMTVEINKGVGVLSDHRPLGVPCSV